MANNTMWLVNTRTMHRVLLAKYYPSSGWYATHPVGVSLENAISKALDEAGVDEDSADDFAEGGRDWVLCYEGDNLLNRSIAADAVNRTATRP